MHSLVTDCYVILPKPIQFRQASWSPSQYSLARCHEAHVLSFVMIVWRNRLQNKSVFGILTIISEGNSFLYLPSFPCMVIVSSLEPAFIQPWFTGDTLHPCFLGKTVQEQFPLSNLPPKILLAYSQWEIPVICHLVWQLIVKFLLFSWYHIV